MSEGSDSPRRGTTDLEVSIRGAALQGVLSPAMIRAFIRRGKSTGLTEKEVLTLVARTQDEVGVPAPPVPDPGNATEEIRDIVRGALLQDVLGPSLRDRLRRRGRSLGLSQEKVEAIIDQEVMRHAPVPLDHLGEEVALDDSVPEDVIDTPSLDLLRRRTGVWLPPESRSTDGAAQPDDDFLPVTLDDAPVGMLPPPDLQIIEGRAMRTGAAGPGTPSVPSAESSTAATQARLALGGAGSPPPILPGGPTVAAATPRGAGPGPAASGRGLVPRLVRHAVLSALSVLLGVGVGYLTFAAARDPQQAALTFELNVPARISVNGRSLGIGWKLGPVEGLPLEENLTVVVDARGFAPVTRQVVLHAGENRVLDLKLLPIKTDREKRDVSLPEQPAGAGLAQGTLPPASGTLSRE